MSIRRRCFMVGRYFCDMHSPDLTTMQEITATVWRTPSPRLRGYFRQRSSCSMKMGRRSTCGQMTVGFVLCMLGGYLLAGVWQDEADGSLDGFSQGSFESLPPGVFPSPGASPSVPFEEPDTFESIILPPPNITLSGEKPARPRFYSTELGTRRKLYVAVLTSPDTVQRQARGINYTLAHITTNIGFYMTGEAGTALPDSPRDVTVFPGQDVNLPVRTAEYISEHYGHLYDYFFVVRDTTYVRGFRLQELAESLSVAEDTFLGSLEDGGCGVDGGLLLSHQVLNSIGDRGSQCAAVSDDGQRDDTVLVQCLQQITQIKCTDTAQGSVFVSHTLADVDTSDVGLNAELLTVRGLQSDSQHRQLHVTSARRELTQLDTRIAQLRAALLLNQRNLRRLLAASAAGVGAADGGDGGPPVEEAGLRGQLLAATEPSWPLGSPAPIRTASRHHINLWQRFTSTHIYLRTQDSVSEPLSRTELEDVQDVIELGMNEIRLVSGLSDYRLVALKSGHRRFDGGRGMDYVMDLEVARAENPQQTELKRVEVHRPILKAELVPMPFVTEKPTVTVVLPVTNSQVQRAQEFVDTVIANNENLGVVLFLISSDSSIDVFRPLIHTVQTFNNRSGSATSRRMGWMTVRDATTPPSQFYIMDAVSKKVSSRALMLLLNGPGLEYQSEMFNRVRMQTIRGWEVFAPAPWIEFHPDLVYNGGTRQQDLQIHKNHGEFDNDFYGIVSFYLEDYKNLRDKTSSSVPRMEYGELSRDRPESYPYDLYGAFVRHSGLHVHRAVDHSFRLYYFTRSCPAQPQSFQDRACVNSLLEGIGNQGQLAQALSEYRQRGKKMPAPGNPQENEV